MNEAERAYWDALDKEIRMAMYDKDLSQQAVADKVGIARETFSNYLRGKREMPFLTLYRIAEVLGTTPAVLAERAQARLEKTERSRSSPPPEQGE